MTNNHPSMLIAWKSIRFWLISLTISDKIGISIAGPWSFISFVTLRSSNLKIPTKLMFSNISIHFQMRFANKWRGRPAASHWCHYLGDPGLHPEKQYRLISPWNDHQIHWIASWKYCFGFETTRKPTLSHYKQENSQLGSIIETLSGFVNPSHGIRSPVRAAQSLARLV